MKDIFLSFSSANEAKANHVCDYLERNQISCFISTRDMRPGMEYAEQLVNALAECKCIVFLLSQASNDSPHVLREIEYAVSHKKPILVYKMEEVTLSKSMEYFLMTHQWLSQDSDQDEELLKAVNQILSLPSDTPESFLSLADSEHKKKRELSFWIPVITLGVLFAGITLTLLFRSGMKDKNEETQARESQMATSASEALASSSTADNNTEYLEESSVESSVESNVDAIHYYLGGTITMGSYLGQPISWRILHVNEDDTLVLVSSEILSIKAFDTAEGGSYNSLDSDDYWRYSSDHPESDELLLKIRGNNDWSLSNIRTWLNSTEEMVTYPDQAPTRKASYEFLNFYSEEAGFLTAFTLDELKCIVPTVNQTRANAFSTDAKDGMVTTTDRVYLLSREELSWFYEANISIYAVPSETAVKNDQSKYYQAMKDNYNELYLSWWLRDHDGSNVSKAYLVDSTPSSTSDEIVFCYTVGINTFGIRPAITVDLRQLEQGPVIIHNHIEGEEE